MKKNNHAAVLWVVALALFCVGLTTQVASAKDLSISLGAGETARIPMKFWCLDFGKPFPQAVTGPTGAATDAVRKTLEAARAKGTLVSDPYQTQLAIWKAADGTFHDVGTEGHAVAEQISTEAAKVVVQAVPSGSTTLEQMVSQGTLKTTVENFKVLTDTTHNAGQAYTGSGDLVIQNVSKQRVSFVLVDGAVFKPAAGVNAQTTTATNEQTLVSHQDSGKPMSLPSTGFAPVGDGIGNWIAVGLLIAGGFLLGCSRWISKLRFPPLWVG